MIGSLDSFFSTHLTKIGLMMAVTTIFFEPEWPRKFLGLKPLAGPRTAAADRPRRVWLAALGCYVLLQFLLPLRHYLYPGYTSWTEQLF